MQIKHSGVCTTDKEVEKMGIYDYKEDGHICQVQVLELSQNENGYGFTLLVTKTFSPFFPKGRIFDIWSSWHTGAYSGMARIWNKGEYIN